MIKKTILLGFVNESYKETRKPVKSRKIVAANIRVREPIKFKVKLKFLKPWWAVD